MTIAHLHVHSHYSLLEATPSLSALVERAVDEGMPGMALTDSFGLYGVVAFTRLCRQAGIQPIVGMTITVSDSPARRPDLLVLLASEPEGYRSLCRLSSHVQGRPDRDEYLERGVDWEVLRACSAGLICLEGGLQGGVATRLRRGEQLEAEQYAARLAVTYPSAYLGLEIHERGDEELAAAIMHLGHRVGLPVVAAQPVYCLESDEGETLRLLRAIDRNCRLDAVPAPDPVRRWCAPAEMAARFARFPEALAAIADVTAQCGRALPSGRPIWPALKLDRSPDEELSRQARDGMQAFYSADAIAAGAPTIVRLQYELETIGRHGFAPLFLVVADIVRYARRKDIPVSTRGSVANSLVAYCLGITTVDPLAHDLLFERFLNPARSSPPDIDLDFCSRRRDEVLAYIRRAYGEERVALVATVSTLQPKSAVRETGKAFGVEEAGIKRLSRLLPRGWHPDPRRRNQRTLADVLNDLENERDREVMSAAFRLVGQPHHLSVHPGGVVITPGPLTDVLPVQWAPKGFLITQFDHVDVEAVGLPKLDLLGIRALTVLADAVERVRLAQQPKLTLAAIPPVDEATAQLLRSGDTIGVFQCESTGAQRTLRQLQAADVADLAVANAFFKPGPATGGMAQAFIRRYRGEESVSYLHPTLEPILRRTKGVLLFQEQILRVAREIAGLSWEQADHLRRGMTRFQPDEMQLIEGQFKSGCQNSGLSTRQTATLWDQVLAFAGYGFNQGHATAYAAVSYQSAYLKAHWPAEFLWARLVNAGGFHHPAVYIAEAVRLGCRVMPPHINVSGRRFTLTQEQGTATLWMGLGHVRDLRRASARAIVAGRPYGTLRDLLSRTSLQEREIRHLIQCGALDGLGESRAAMLAEADDADRAGSIRQMAFSFAAREQVAPESAAQRIAWERSILGQPMTVHPLALLDSGQDTVPIGTLGHAAGRTATVRGVRLPGWTGGRGFFLADETSFVVAQMEGDPPAVWQPHHFRGQWRTDAWGGGWFQVQQMI